MRYLIALPLRDSESQDFIELRDKYASFAPRWKITLGPHITLYRPSEFSIAKAEAIKDFEKAPKLSDFTANFNGFEAFLNHSNNAVYSEPADYNVFKSVKASYISTANKIMQDTSDVWPYHPHLTLVNRLDTESAKKLLNELEGLKFNKTYTFDRVCLYKKEHEDKNWIEIASNRLEK
jgi:2'-5' RNA ligase